METTALAERKSCALPGDPDYFVFDISRVPVHVGAWTEPQSKTQTSVHSYRVCSHRKLINAALQKLKTTSGAPVEDKEGGGLEKWANMETLLPNGERLDEALVAHFVKREVELTRKRTVKRVSPPYVAKQKKEQHRGLKEKEALKQDVGDAEKESKEEKRESVELKFEEKEKEKEKERERLLKLQRARSAVHTIDALGALKRPSQNIFVKRDVEAERLLKKKRKRYIHKVGTKHAVHSELARSIQQSQKKHK